MTELHVIKGCEEGIPHIIMTTANGREDTDPVTWLAMELVQIDSNSRQRSRLVTYMYVQTDISHE